MVMVEGMARRARVESSAPLDAHKDAEQRIDLHDFLDRAPNPRKEILCFEARLGRYQHSQIAESGAGDGRPG